MENTGTCGAGLAEHSALPAKLSELTASVADNLELHMQALDLKDERSRKEHDAYAQLAKQHRAIAASLQATATQMASYRDLPMGRHDQHTMSSPNVVEAFERFMKREQELLALLEKSVQRDETMLGSMTAARRP